MSASLKTILLLLALTCLIKAHDDTICDHHEHQEKYPPTLLDIEEDFRVLEQGKGRMLQGDYPHMRIYANYDNLAQTASASYVDYIKNELATPVLAYFEAALKVKYPVVGNLVISSSVRDLCDLSVPTDLRNGVPADYAILFNSKSASSSLLATSYNCNLASGSKRPLVGKTDFNRNGITPAGGDIIRHEKNTYLLFHEIMHTLGFSKSLYKYFIDENGKTLTGHIKSASIGGTTHTVIDVPSLTQKLRDFFGCANVPGAIMENGDDSHWDKKLFLYETMQSGSITGKRMSPFSLGLLEASGWYEVDYDYAEPYFWGQGQGCNFVNSGSCSSSTAAFDEFCVGSNRGCNYPGNSGGSCSSSSNMDNCKFMLASSSYNCEVSSNAGNAKLSGVEVFGRDAGSRCFSGTLSTRSSSSINAYCLKYNCVGSGMDTKLEVILGSTKAVCTQEGNLSVDGYYGYVDCPDPLTFCNTVGKKYCPRGCMGRGSCENNKCECFPGFTGVDCGLDA
jgi:hypothetical protein